MMTSPRWRFLLTLLAPLLMHPLPARAHAGLPETSNVAVRRNHDADLLVGATFGAVISRDSGQTWQWICPAAMGYGGWRPSSFLWQESGAILAATGNALIRSPDMGCSWSAHPFFASTWVTALAQHPTDERLLYVATGKYASANAVYRSDDGGETWRVTSLQRPDVQFSMVMVSPADPRRVYASGSSATQLLLYRSDDAGETWSEVAQPLPQLTRPYDLALLKASPANADVLWARVSAQGLSYIFRSDDSGQTLTQVLQLEDIVVDAECSSDGRTVWVSTPVHMYRSKDGAAFETLPLPDGNACGLRVGDTLYGCGSVWVHGWSLARSHDEGTSWEPFLDLAKIQGAYQCPACTPTQQQCPSQWPALAQVLGAPVESTADGGTEPPAVCSADGGTPEPVDPPKPKSGCTTTTGLLPCAAVLFTLPFLRRTRRTPSPSGRGRG